MVDDIYLSGKVIDYDEDDEGNAKVRILGNILRKDTDVTTESPEYDETMNTRRRKKKKKTMADLRKEKKKFILFKPRKKGKRSTIHFFKRKKPLVKPFVRSYKPKPKRKIRRR